MAGEGATCPPAVLAAFAAELLVRVGTPPEHAQLTAQALVTADVEGIPSHGLMLLPMYLERIEAGSVAPRSEGRIVSERGGDIVMDAENGLGQVTSDRAVSLALARAPTHGSTTVAVRNAFHFGTAGYWARKLALGGCIGIVMSNTRPLMPAPGGAERLVGNNPLAIAAPTLGEPIVFDMATSASAMGKIRMAAARGEAIPEGWAADADGQPTTDASAAIRGMLLPSGGAKGFGLAMMIDLLAGGLSGGAIGEAVSPLYGDASVPYRCSHLFVALPVAAFQPVEEFAAAATHFAGRIRNSRAATGAEAVRAPGDRAAAARARSAEPCRLAASTIEALRQAAARLSVPLPNPLSP